MTTLIDANIIIRFFVSDNQAQFEKTKLIFLRISNNSLQVEILDAVLMEVYFVLTKQYGINKSKIISKLKDILIMPGIVGDKHISIKALDMVQSHIIDYVNAVICAKSALQGFDKISFDKKVIEC